jgi:hypothetical protein
VSAEKGKEAELGCFWRRAEKVKGKDKRKSLLLFSKAPNFDQTQLEI